MAIVLGRDAGLTWNGLTVTAARDMLLNVTTVTRDIQPFGSRSTISYQTGYGLTLTVETIDDAAASTAFAAAVAGTEIAVVAGGYSFTAVVTNVSDAMPLEEKRAWSIEMRKTQAGLRT